MINFLEQTQTETEQRPVAPLKLSEHKPKEFLLNIAKRLKSENESTRAKEQAQTIYQMCCRHRGMTLADNFGYWREGIYCSSPMFAQLHSTNVFQSLVRGAEANFNQADIRLDIKANSNNRDTRAVVKIVRSIYEILKERQWTETARQSAFYANILKLNAFYISRFDKSKGNKNVPVPQYEQTSYEESGDYVCPECYHSAPYSEVTTQGCESCGNETLSIINEPTKIQDYLVNGFEKQIGGETELVIADGLDVSVDPDGKPADIKSCRWVEWRYLAQESELKRLYPHIKCEGRTEWSYQTRLKQGLKRYKVSEEIPTSEVDRATREVRQIWLDLTEYEDYVPPIDFRIGSFTFRKGVPMKEDCPNGAVFAVTGNDLLFVDPENKNKRVAASLWLSDGVSFAGQGAKAGLSIQRKINMLDNMAMEGEARSMKGSMLYNPLAVDGASLEGANTNIALKLDYVMDDKGFNNVAQPIQVEGLSQYSLMYLAGQKQTMQEVMGVPDVALGQDTSADKTFGGQVLRSRNASGLLVPATQSTARAMELWLSHQLDLIQSFSAPESLLDFGSTYGEEWQPEEIEAFFNADLEKDVTIAYVPGSEIPESRAEKQMRLRQDIANGFIQLTPELQSQLARESNYDGLDVNNFDSNQKLADTRWNLLKESLASNTQLEQIYQVYEQQMTDPQTGMRLTDETGNPLPNPVLMQIINLPDLQIYKQAENHQQMVEYWSGKTRELASSKQSKLLTALCDAMITKHIQSQFELQMKDQTLQGLTGVPMAATQKMLEGENGDKSARNK